MSTRRTANEVANRFIAEQGEVLSYVRFILERTATRDYELIELRTAVRELGLSEMTFRDGYPATATVEPDQILPEIRQTVTDIFVPRLAGIAEAMKRLPSPRRDQSIDRDVVRQWSEFLRSEFRNAHLSSATVEAIRTAAVEGRIRPSGLAEGPINPDAVDLALEGALFAAIGDKWKSVGEVMNRVIAIQFGAMARMPDTQVNIYRQGFILVMTAFDAAVFDLTRIALRVHFFRLIGAFGGDRDVSIDRLGSSGSFKAFRDSVIEDLVRVRYLRELLFELRHLGVRCLDEDKSDAFPRMVEMVLRRNVHLHNRGVVDDRYLERKDGGKPKWNLDNFGLGDYAPIDKPYFERAARLCRSYVRGFAAWIKSGCPTPD